jgi:NAD(P)H-flavin reductase
MGQIYIIFGVVAMLLVTILYLGSLKRGIQRTGYQVFKLTHYITAGLYLGACWAHWAPLACWMIAAIILLAIDRGVRLLRLVLIHTGHVDARNPIGFKKARANMKVFEDEDGGQILRIEFEHNHGPWRAGQHFYLTFPQLAWWQAHPFTPTTLASPHPRLQRHVYVLRVKKGITRRLADLVTTPGGESSLDILLTGPYGVGSEVADGGRPKNMLAIAGGTGISFVFPVVLQRLATSADNGNAGITQLVWIVRKTADIQWFLAEIEGLKRAVRNQTDKKAGEGDAPTDKVDVQILVTRESTTGAKAVNSSASSPMTSDVREETNKEAIFDTEVGSSISERIEALCAGGRFAQIKWFKSHHPDIAAIVNDFAALCKAESIGVMGSGPVGMGTDLKGAVAKLNQGLTVWRGEEKGDVGLISDLREL